MLFLYRPPQTYMPYNVRRPSQQAAYNREQQNKFAATRRRPRPEPAQDRVADLQRLGELRDSGVLTDDEFAAEKARVLAGGSA